MTAALQLSVQILDMEPRPKPQRQLQLWKGGRTDLATRTMIADPARWLLLAEYDAGATAATVDGTGAPVLAWDLDQILPGDQLSPIAAGGVILVAMDVEPAQEDEFNDWYNTEHIPRFLRVPGVIAGRRFRARTGAPRYVALYHVDSTAVYATPEWMAVNETPWIRRLRRFQHNRTYFMFETAIAVPE